MVYEQKHIDPPMSLLDLRLRQGGRYVQYYFDMDRTSSTVFPDFYHSWRRHFCSADNRMGVVYHPANRHGHASVWVLSLEHQTFNGWFYDSQYTQEAIISLASETLTYYGYYEPIYYTLNFYDSDLLTIIHSDEIIYEETLTFPEGPAKSSNEIFDYEFTGWNLPELYQSEIISVFPEYKALFKSSLIRLNQSVDTVYENDVYQDEGVSSLSDLLRIEAVNQINTAKAGKYPLYYAVYYQDEIIYYFHRLVTVLPKEVDIILTMRKAISTLYVGDTYKEEGAYANYGTVTVTGNVDTSVAGVYVITYQAKYLEQTKVLKRYVYVLEKPVTEETNVYYYYKEEEYLYEA